MIELEDSKLVPKAVCPLAQMPDHIPPFDVRRRVHCLVGREMNERRRIRPRAACDGGPSPAAAEEGEQHRGSGERAADGSNAGL